MATARIWKDAFFDELNDTGTFFNFRVGDHTEVVPIALASASQRVHIHKAIYLYTLTIACELHLPLADPSKDHKRRMKSSLCAHK